MYYMAVSVSQHYQGYHYRIAAQHGRYGYKAEFEEKYADVMKAYYDSVAVEETDFTGATKGSPPEYRKSSVPKSFDGFPLVKKQIGLLSNTDLNGKDTKRFKEETPSTPPPGLRRLRAFIHVYSQLPLRQDDAPGGVAVEGGKKTEEGDKSPGTELPKTSGFEESPIKVESPSKGESSSEPTVKVEPTIKVEPSSSKKPEKESSKNQYVQNLGGPAIPAAWFQLLPNPGGGDCLFHAVEGRNLNGVEMLAIRGRVSTIRKRMPDSPLTSAYNANVAAATITQTPSLARFAPLVQGRDAVPNSVLAMMQLIPGVYAGPEELIQWCQLCDRTVFVIDQDGSITRYTAGGSRPLWKHTAGTPDRKRQMMLNLMQTLIGGGCLVLYKSPAHWERIQALSDRFGT